jgi:hypothetical protein
LSQGIPSISEFLTPVGKTSREALISREPNKFVEKISLNSRSNKVYQKLNKIQNYSPKFSIVDAIPDISVVSDLRHISSSEF